MKVLVCIDDTDTLGGRGTGHLAALLAEQLTERGWGKPYPITRHQLYVHPDIPYTSHNSAMCFLAEMPEDRVVAFREYAAEFLFKESAAGSDPGLCVAAMDGILNPNRLIGFGQAAKKRVLTKQEAYALAQEQGVHLSEHGGTGQGIIGALAGVGLRLSGNDGRFRGKYQIVTDSGILRVADIYARAPVDSVRTEKGRCLSVQDLVRLGEKVKSVLLNGQSVLLVERDEPGNGTAVWRTIPHERVKKY
ncbi:MAG TPA: hypothetical protein PLG17_12120 [Thermodesulfobacteriota bacterium]|nr:hypothetical protein [Thermodesulfobacteriota bacterium]HQO79242.1 hypothetical protein [Thermodesulfobacteriota bacterium]